MKKFNALLLSFVLIGTFQLVGCKKKDEPKPANELIQRTWSAKEVLESANKVFDLPYDATTDTRDYRSFTLAFTATDVTITELDGYSYTGKWALTNNNNNLVISQLVDAPTGVGSTVEYVNVKVASNELRLTRSGNNPKTGQSNTEYIMQPK